MSSIFVPRVDTPFSTIDLSIITGADIPIEERPPEEVTHIAGHRIAPDGIGVRNPAFDVTPNEYITAIITERGILRPPYSESLKLAQVASTGGVTHG